MGRDELPLGCRFTAFNHRAKRDSNRYVRLTEFPRPNAAETFRAARRHISGDRSGMRRVTKSQAASSRSRAGPDRASPSSKRSPRTQRTKEGGGAWPSDRAKTSSTASGDSAWVEGLASRLASISEKKKGAGVFLPASRNS